MDNPNIVSLPYLDVEPVIYDIFKWIVDAYPGFVTFMKNFLGVLVGLSIPLSVLFLITIIYSVERLKMIRKEEELIFDTKVEPIYNVAAGDDVLSRRWETVKTHIESSNPNDWRQSILEADIILDELLTKIGYKGDSIGDKLKRVERGDFATLNDAWEGHKVRNQVAHGGSTFSLNHHEAKRAIEHYRRVFEEFYYI